MSVQRIIEAWKGRPFKDILIELYIDKDYTIQEVSEELKISVGVVHNYLRKFNIDKQPKLWTNKLERTKKKR